MENINQDLKRCLNCKKPNCINGCPLHTDIPLLINLLKANKINDAIKVQYQYNSIPFICGKLCDHERQCLGGCNLKSDPIKINEMCFELGIKRLKSEVNLSVLNGKMVAVVGGGIGGLIVSERLLETGFKVDLFEKTDRLGGVLAQTMPDFRYDKRYLNLWIERLYKLGLNVKFNQIIGNNLFITDLCKYDAIVIAVGASNPRKLFSNDFSIDALTILNQAKHNLVKISNQKVIVLGGGNTAFDVARTMKRLGNQVSIAYRRDLANSLASKKEINLAIEEGIEILECLAPKDVVRVKNNLLEITFNKTLLKNENETRKSFITTDEIVKMETNLIIEAVGASCDLSFLDQSILDEHGYAKSIINDNLYIIGDAYLGPSSFVKTNQTAIICANDIISKGQKL